jgi:regulator of protease activity HflC (stomatin/prohibitin superfamily)
LKEWERVAVLRPGKFLGIKGPGIIWIIPILDRIVAKVSLLEQQSEVDTGK